MQAQNALADRLAFRQRQSLWQRQNLVATSLLIVASSLVNRAPESFTLPHLIRTYQPSDAPSWWDGSDSSYRMHIAFQIAANHGRCA